MLLCGWRRNNVCLISMSACENGLESSNLCLVAAVRPLCEVIVCAFVMCVCVCVAMFFAGEATLF